MAKKLEDYWDHRLIELRKLIDGVVKEIDSMSINALSIPGGGIAAHNLGRSHSCLIEARMMMGNMLGLFNNSPYEAVKNRREVGQNVTKAPVHQFEGTFQWNDDYVKKLDQIRDYLKRFITELTAIREEYFSKSQSTEKDEFFNMLFTRAYSDLYLSCNWLGIELSRYTMSSNEYKVVK